AVVEDLVRERAENRHILRGPQMADIAPHANVSAEVDVDSPTDVVSKGVLIKIGDLLQTNTNQTDADERLQLNGSGAKPNQQIVHPAEHRAFRPGYLAKKILGVRKVGLKSEDWAHRTQRGTVIAPLVFTVAETSTIRGVTPEVEPD